MNRCINPVTEARASITKRNKLLEVVKASRAVVACCGLLSFFLFGTIPRHNDKIKQPASGHNVLVQGRPTSNESFSSLLYLLNTDNSTILADGNLAQYDKSYCACVDQLDAMEFDNINEMFGLVRDSVRLAMERRPLIANSDTLFFSLLKTTQRRYQFQFTATALNHPGLIAFLKDSYTHDSTQLNLNGTTVVNFSVTSDEASQDAYRFMAVFQQAQGGVVPITYISIKAWQQGNGNTLIQWSTTNELNSKDFIIERSIDGIHFTAIGTVPANNNISANNYLFTDNNPVQGIAYYRLQLNDIDGGYKNSEVVAIKLAGKGIVVVYPVPAKNYIDVQYSRLAANAVLKINSEDGKIINAMQLAQGSSQARVDISSLTNGDYFINVNDGSTVKTIKFIKQ